MKITSKSLIECNLLPVLGRKGGEMRSIAHTVFARLLILKGLEMPVTFLFLILKVPHRYQYKLLGIYPSGISIASHGSSTINSCYHPIHESVCPLEVASMTCRSHLRQMAL